jgi:hypothetical protein
MDHRNDGAIDEARAREIAEDEARSVYGDLAPYVVSVRLQGGRWRVDYDLADATAVGGGPHFLIDAATGEIVERRYEQ